MTLGKSVSLSVLLFLLGQSGDETSLVLPSPKPCVNLRTELSPSTVVPNGGCLSSRKHFAMSGDTLVLTPWRQRYWHQVGDVNDFTEKAIIHRIAPRDQELAGRFEKPCPSRTGDMEGTPGVLFPHL